MIKLIALDLDGTLLNPDSRLADVDRDAVIEARDRGVQIVLSTARWHGIALRTARRLEINTPLICHNGAHVETPDSTRTLLHETVPQDAAREIAALCDEHAWETYTTIERITYMRVPWEDVVDPERLPEGLRLARTHVDHITGPATGFVVFGEEAVQGLISTFGVRFEGTVAFPVGRSEIAQPYVTITAAGCDKGTALRLVCGELGVALDDVLAVGDAQPDVDMFDIVRTGVAMGNASDDVKARADAVAPSNAEGGVAWALREFVLDGG
jgi:hydroxymethylpyrimidine pyrophosphatase-like HAD family hydrolase